MAADTARPERDCLAFRPNLLRASSTRRETWADAPVVEVAGVAYELQQVASPTESMLFQVG